MTTPANVRGCPACLADAMGALLNQNATCGAEVLALAKGERDAWRARATVTDVEAGWGDER